MVFTWDSQAPTSLKAVFVAGFTLGTVTLLSSIWCILAIFSSKRLRKPLWFFRASLCIKDISLCVAVLLPNLSFYPEQTNTETRRLDPYVAGAIIACISASIFTLLCSSVDRYHASRRPFRYHMGELMPNGVAATLIFHCWMFGIVTSICVVTDYNQPDRSSYGVLLQFVTLESWQKALLVTGYTLVMGVSTWLLGMSLASVLQQKRESRLRLENGQEEPIRSRRNSFSEDQYLELSSNKTTVRLTESDSEPDANQLFLQIAGPVASVKKTKRKWSLRLSQDPSFFTPTAYRPSILRRIKNTWYLYVVVIICAVTYITTILPFYYLILAGENCDNLWNDELNFTANVTDTKVVETWRPLTSNTHCVFAGVADCFILSQGFICVLIYTFADDVFRPVFLMPVSILLIPFRWCRGQSASEATYSVGRRRTLSRNSNALSSGL